MLMARNLFYRTDLLEKYKPRATTDLGELIAASKTVMEARNNPQL